MCAKFAFLQPPDHAPIFSCFSWNNFTASPSVCNPSSLPSFPSSYLINCSWGCILSLVISVQWCSICLRFAMPFSRYFSIFPGCFQCRVEPLHILNSHQLCRWQIYLQTWYEIQVPISSPIRLMIILNKARSKPITKCLRPHTFVLNIRYLFIIKKVLQPTLCFLFVATLCFLFVDASRSNID